MQWLMVFLTAMILAACGSTETEAPPEAETEQTDSPVDTAAQEKAVMTANAKTHVYTIYTDFEQGSGFLFNNKGDILTNAHVVRDATFISLVNSDGQEFAGKVIGMSLDEDLALVRVEELAGKSRSSRKWNRSILAHRSLRSAALKTRQTRRQKGNHRYRRGFLGSFCLYGFV